MSPFYRRASEAQGRGVAGLGSQSGRAALYPVSFRCCPWMRIYAVTGILVLAVPLGVTTEVAATGPGASWGRLTVDTAGILCLPRGSRQALPPHGLASPFTTQASTLRLEAEVPNSAAGARLVPRHPCVFLFYCLEVFIVSSGALPLPAPGKSPPASHSSCGHSTPLVSEVGNRRLGGSFLWFRVLLLFPGLLFCWLSGFCSYCWFYQFAGQNAFSQGHGTPTSRLTGLWWSSPWMQAGWRPRRRRWM